MVARVPFLWLLSRKRVRHPSPRATIKALPSLPYPTRPYGSIGILSVSIASGDAYWRSLVVALPFSHSFLTLTPKPTPHEKHLIHLG